MGKVTVYQCDICGIKYNKPSEVIIIDGMIYDGDERIIYNGDEKELICKTCFIKNFELNKEPEESINDKIIDIESEEKPKEIVFLKRIFDERSEDEFIHFIGHTSRDSFNNVYNGSLIYYYYPIEFDKKEIPDIESFKKSRVVDVIHKVFASIPQVKKFKVFVNEEKDLAIVDKELFEE